MSSFVYGFHPVREAVRRRPRDVVEVQIAVGRAGSRREEIADLCRAAGVKVRAVPDQQLHAASGGVDNGFVARLRSESRVVASGDADLRVLLEDVQDPRNLGAILRVCEGAGVGQVVVRDRGSAPLSAVTAKASAGASEWLQVTRVPNSANAISQCKRDGFWVYGLAAGGVPPWEIDLSGKVLLCLGGEGDGLRQLTQRSCDGIIGLPMRGQVESLNVATAAAAVLYEAVRQRSSMPAKPNRSAVRREEVLREQEASE